MKVKKMTAICKKAKHLEVAEDQETNGKWMSNGAMYAFMGYNNSITIADVLFTMDLKDTDADKIRTYNRRIAISEIEMAEKIHPMRYSINVAGVLVIPFHTSEGLMLIQHEFMCVFDDVERKSYMLTNYNGSPCMSIVDDDSGDVIGVIMPMAFPPSEMQEFASQLSTSVKRAIDNGFLCEPEQVSM